MGIEEDGETSIPSSACRTKGVNYQVVSISSLLLTPIYNALYLKGAIPENH